MKINISDYKKVVFGKPEKGGSGSGSGGGGSQSQQVPPDVEMYNPYGEEEGEDGEKKEGEGEDGQTGKPSEKGQGDGKGKGEEGDGEGEGKEGSGKGKSGKSGKGGKGSGSNGEDGLSRDQIEKGAQELLDKLNKTNNLPTSPCGSNAKRSDKQQSEDKVEQDKIEQQAEIARKQIEDILQKTKDEGHEHVFTPRGRGTGGKETANAPKGDVVPVKMRKPEFLKKMKDFANKEYEREYYKKGTDWFYSQAYGDILFKDKPKVSIPQKFVYIMVDVSGSMFTDFGGTGISLLEYLLGYLPVIAEDFKGEVWWISDGLIRFRDGSPAVTKLSEYKDMKPEAQSKFFKKVQNAYGAGGGTTFGVELQAVQNIREKEKHKAAIIILTDSFIDTPKTTYKYNDKVVEGNLPPSTILMTDKEGCAYIKKMFPEDFKNKDLRIECFDITENGRYKIKE